MATPAPTTWAGLAGQPLQRRAVGREAVDEQQAVAGQQEPLGHDDGAHRPVGEGGDLSPFLLVLLFA